MEEVLSAKREILKAAQKDAFSREMGMLRPFKQGQDRSSAQHKKRAMKATGSLYRLDPYLDQDGVLLVSFAAVFWMSRNAPPKETAA